MGMVAYVLFKFKVEAAGSTAQFTETTEDKKGGLLCTLQSKQVFENIKKKKKNNK